MGSKKAIGQRGSWFAKVDGISIPCAHKYWLNGLHYHDPFTAHTAGQDKIDELVQAIKEVGKVVMTDDKPERNSVGEVVGFVRLGYIALYAVEDVSYDHAGGLRFRIAKRLENLI